MSESVYSILDFGAVPNGDALCTEAIQNAIDTCSAAGGGVVLVPAGMYTIGTLWLRSHVELHLSSGAVLKASKSLDDFNTADAYPQNWGCPNEQWNACHLIIAHEVEDVAITGDGIIDGSGDAYFDEPVFAGSDPGSIWMYYTWEFGLSLAKDKERLRPGQALVFIESRKIRLENFTIRNVTCWSCFLHGCDFAVIRGLKIFNTKYYCNTDGIDIDSCSHVTVSDCIIDTGDDAIAIRGSNRVLKQNEKVCEYVAVSNCVLGSSSSVFRIGVGKGDITHVSISDIVITRGGTGLHIMGDWNREYSTGIRDIKVSNVTAEHVNYPIVISAGAWKPVSDITVDNFTAECTAACKIYAPKSALCRKISLRNVELRLSEKVLPVPMSDGIRNVRGNSMVEVSRVERLTLDNFTVTADAECAGTWNDMLRVRDCPGISLENVSFPKP